MSDSATVHITPLESPLVWVIDDAVEDRELVVRVIRQTFPRPRIDTPLDQAGLDVLLKGDRPDVVVTDYRLGWSDGLEVLARVKARDPSIPVIMFTNTGSEEVCAEGMKAGLSDYIIKRRDQYPKVSHSVRVALDLEEARRRLAVQQDDLTRSQAELTELLQRERRARAEAEAARAEAMRAAKLKDQFLATLSHELRTPLNAVLGWAHLLQMKKDDAKALQQGLEVIIRNTRLQAQLVADLLDMSRIVSGQMRLDLQVVDLGAAAAAVVQSVKPNADQKRIQLDTRLPPEPLMVRGDPTRIEQVVWNLLSNAVKFTPAQGRVTVTLGTADGHAVLDVEDTGEGIAGEFLPHVFDMFRQADGSRSRQHGGLGIGLTIARQLVEMHGGGIAVHSHGPGRGSRFTVRLPLVAAEPAFGPRHAMHSGTLAKDLLADLLVLSVDDDPDTCDVITNMLGEYGARVECAHSAAEGYERLRTRRPQVLVSDIGMPGEDGYAFIARVRKLGPLEGGATPALALSAFARGEDRQRALLAGFDAFAAKPVEPQELVAAVAELAGRLRGKNGV